MGFGIAFQNTGATELTARVNGNDIDSAEGTVGFLTEDTAEVVAQVNENTLSGSLLEIIVTGASQFCLDLEDNSNDDEYALFLSPLGTTNSLSVEQFSALTVAQPSGAGNQGTVNTDGSDPIANVADGFCGF